MKQVRFQSGGSVRGDGSGDAAVTIPSNSQLTYVRIMPGTDEETLLVGTWVKINESGPMFITCPLFLCADTFGWCCGDDWCDMYPGDVQIVILIGAEARPGGDTRVEDTTPDGAPSTDWLIVYTGGRC